MSVRRYRRQISLIDISPPFEPSNESELDWIFECLGLGDESDELAREIFRAIVRANKERHGITSRELKERGHVTQAAIIYHLNTFMRSGVIVKQGRVYLLRAPTLEETLEEMENELMLRFERLKKIAKKIEENSRY